MRGFLTALEFLTPFKIGKIKILPDKELAKSMAWFGVVGLLIGLASAAAYSLLNLFLPKIVVSAIIVLVMIIMSRGLHLDGLADVVDGFVGARDKNDTIRIMHDSNIGAIGAAAIFICLLIKFSCIYSFSEPVAIRALIVSAVLARCSFVFSAVKWPAANEGLGKKFIEYAGKKELFSSSIIAFIVALFTFGIKGIAIVFLVVLLITVFNTFIKHKLDGLTGDTLGAIGEITEAAVLLFVLI